MTIESTTSGRCRNLECEERDHKENPEIFCHEWVPYPVDQREVCSVCKSVFATQDSINPSRMEMQQTVLDERRDRMERRAKLSVDLRASIVAYLSEYGVEGLILDGTASDVVDETLNDVIDEYGDGS